MKNAIHLITAIAFVMFLAGCGALEGNDPEGVTGGHEGGYGSLGAGSGFYGGDGPDVLIIGNWQRGTIGSDQYETIQFNADGQCVRQAYKNGTLADAASGKFSTSEKSITFTFDGAVQSGSFSVSGSTLTINLDGQSNVWTKM